MMQKAQDSWVLTGAAVCGLQSPRFSGIGILAAQEFVSA